MTYLWPAKGATVDYISTPPAAAWAEGGTRSLALLGSTGSIGVSALKVVEAVPHLFAVTALAGARNVRLLAEQAVRWRPRWLGVLDGQAVAELHTVLRGVAPSNYRPEIVCGPEGYAHLAALAEVDTVLSAQVGAAGLRATVAAALAGKVICLANKESLVLAGGLIRDICARTHAVILPVDSEHNAIFQALAGRPAAHVRRIVLTASGGPFRGKSREELRHVTRAQALHHPNWSMGAKITIDSATLMNKGLEVMEAFHLYGVGLEAIDVVIHPQSLVHSLVEFADGSLMAHLGSPDMRMAIAHCMAWPHCLDSGVAPLDLVKAGTLTFSAPDIHSFPCLELARRALRERGGQSVVLNAANEAAVELFLAERIGFADIPVLLEQAMNSHAATMPGNAPLCPPLPPLPGDAAQEKACGSTPEAAGAHVSPLLDAIMALDEKTRRQVYACAGIQE